MLMLFILTFMAFALVMLLVVVKVIISDRSISSYSREEVSSYECGFEQYSLSRIPLSIRYFMLTLVFLIFDLEIMLLIFSPSDLPSLMSTPHAYLVSTMFILVLFLGLIFEWYDGSLEWVM